jgi:hypothetical protein
MGDRLFYVDLFSYLLKHSAIPLGSSLLTGEATSIYLGYLILVALCKLAVRLLQTNVSL